MISEINLDSISIDVFNMGQPYLSCAGLFISGQVIDGLLGGMLVKRENRRQTF